MRSPVETEVKIESIDPDLTVVPSITGHPGLYDGSLDGLSQVRSRLGNTRKRTSTKQSVRGVTTLMQHEVGRQRAQLAVITTGCRYLLSEATVSSAVSVRLGIEHRHTQLALTARSRRVVHRKPCP